VLALLLGWAALFLLGPLACLVLLGLQLGGIATPDGSGWLYPATALAWVAALGAWSAGRSATRAAARIGTAFANRSWLRPRRRRVVIVDAATGMPLPGQAPGGEDPHAVTPPPGWEWSRKRESEVSEWAETAARVKQALREREAASRVPRGSGAQPPPRASRPAGAPGPSRGTGPRPAARPQERRADPPPPPPPRPEPPAAPDPWATLGLKRGASQDAIRKAYRDLVKQYHPDRVAGMPKEFQSIATEKTREIRGAYEALRRPDGS
jgi:DnaJ-domain-containing protein 1